MSPVYFVSAIVVLLSCLNVASVRKKRRMLCYSISYSIFLVPIRRVFLG